VGFIALRFRRESKTTSYLDKIMMKRLRGRSLVHPGCLIGVTAGLTLGIIMAGVMAASFNVALNMVLLTWLGMTLGLGALGWVIGARLSSKFPALEEETVPAAGEGIAAGEKELDTEAVLVPTEET